MRMKIFLFVALLLGFCCPSESISATYYLRADGTVLAADKANATGCADATTAMSIAQHNAALFSAGDTITLCDTGGAFAANLVPPSSGSSGNPINYTNSGSPIITGADSEPTPTRSECIRVSSKNYLTFRNLEIRYSSENNFLIEGTATGIVADTLNSHHSGQDGYKNNSTGSLTLTNCTGSSNTDDGASWHDGTGVVTGGSFNSNGTDGIHNSGDSTITIVGTTLSSNLNWGINIEGTSVAVASSITSESNTTGSVNSASGSSITVSSSTLSGGATTVRFNTSANGTIQTSTISGASGSMVNIEGGSGQHTITRNILYGNSGEYAIRHAGTGKITITRNWKQGTTLGYYFDGPFAVGADIQDGGQYVYRIGSGGDSLTNTIENFYIGSTSSYAIRADDYAVSISNGIIIAGPNDVAVGIGNCAVKSCITDKAGTQLPSGNGNVNGATITNYVISTDTGNADYAKIKPGGSGIDAGVAVSITQDYAGVTIPQGALPDIGAYEYVSANHRKKPVWFQSNSSSLAPTYVYFVDPTYEGETKLGSSLNPWTSLTNTGAWTEINSALTSGNVTIYFSARNAAGDTDNDLSAKLDITSRTDTSSHILTVDGKTYYNTNTSSPAWSVHTGTGRSKNQGVTLRKNDSGVTSYVTVNGFNVVNIARDKAIEWCGSYITITNCDFSHSGDGAGTGPLAQMAPTADSAHQGSSNPCPPQSNIAISTNKFHDSYGELLYIGAGGCSGIDRSGETSCNGYPSHDTITISGNEFYNGGVYGAQGDGIDVKMSVTNITITGNNIHDLSTDACGIKLYGQNYSGLDQNALIEKNYIHDLTGDIDAAIALSNQWGVSKGVTIRNNIIDTVVGAGIISYEGEAGYVPTLEIYNNTVYSASSYGMSIGDYNSATLKNNLLLANNGGSNNAQASIGASGSTITESNNGYTGTTFGGSCTSCQGSMVLADTVVDAAGADFTLKAGSSALGNGTTIASFSDDYSGTSRTVPWSIGAYK